MSLSFDNWTNVVLEGLKEHGKKLSEECVSRLASPLYIPHPILDEYLSRLNIFLDLPKPTQEEITKAGYLLEEIALICFCGLIGHTSIKSFRSPSAQYDLVISGDTMQWKLITEILYLNFTQRDIVIEVKATTDSLSDSQFARLCSIMSLNLTNAGLGIFFTLNGASGFPKSGEARQQKIGNARLRQVIFYASTKKAIVVLDKNDILTLNQNGSLIALLMTKISDLNQLSGLPTAPVEELEDVDLPESPSQLKQIYTQICARKNITTNSD